MRILLVHQNIPGQFRDLAPALCDRGHELKAIGSSQRPMDPRIEVLRYGVDKPERQGIHRLSGEVDEWIRRAEQVAELARSLRQRGWAPDVMLAHPGWGETLLLRDVFPSSPLVVWPELWLRPEHLGQPAAELSVADQLYLRVKNWLLEGAMAQAQLAILPTQYQASSFPEAWQSKIQVIHEGVDPELCQAPRLERLCLGPAASLEPEVPVITFISRNLEPMRGFPTFMEALPLLQQHPSVQVVVVGGDEVSYSQAGPDGRCWRELMLERLGPQLDRSRLHLFPRIPHPELIKLYRRSNLHVYLSRPFVLSWSLVEVMACATPILAAANPMTAEVISPGQEGGLCPEHPQALAAAMLEGIRDPQRLRNWGENARRRVEREFLRPHCLEKLIGVIEPLSQGCF